MKPQRRPWLKSGVKTSVLVLALWWAVWAHAAPLAILTTEGAKVPLNAQTVNGTGSVGSDAIDLIKVGAHGIWYRCTSATGTPNIRVEWLESPSVESTEFTTQLFLETALTSESAQLKGFDVLSTPERLGSASSSHYARVILAGNTGNPADTVCTVKLFVEPTAQVPASQAITVLNTSDVEVKPGDSPNNAVRVNIVAGGGAGGTSSTDEAAYTPTATAGTPAMAAVDDTAPDSAAEGTVGIVRMTPPRALHVNLRDNAGAEVSVGGGTQYDQGTTTTATDKLTMGGAIRRDTAVLDAGVADGDRAALSTDSVGRLRVTAADTTQPVSQNNFLQPDADTGAGTTLTASVGLLLPASGGPVLGGTSTNPIRVDPTGTTTQPVSGPLTDAQLRATAVPVSGTVTITDGAGAVNVICDSGCSGGTQYDEDTVSSAADKVTMAGVVRKDTAASLVDTDGDRTQLQVDATGRVWTHVGAVDGTVTVTGAAGALALDATLTGRLPIGSTPADNESNAVTTTRVGTFPFVFDGTTWDRWTGAVTLSAGTNNIGDVDVLTFPDNEPFNLAQVAGAVPSATNPLPTRASDGSAFIDLREIEGQNNARPIYCGSTAFLDMSTATTTQIVALSGSTVVYVCSYAVMAGGTANVKLVRGTGTNCATGQAAITPNFPLVAQAGINRVAGGGNVVTKGNAGDAVCATSSAAVTVVVEVSYAQF
jgi:hypothetical protein